MKIWKIKQEIYHRLNHEFKDDLNAVDIEITEDIVGEAIHHFHHKVNKWIYPAKSYFVAICYASWIAKDFGEDFYETLNDPGLLAGNDPFFVPYHKANNIYDEILSVIDATDIKMTGMVPDVKEYYDAEIGYE